MGIQLWDHVFDHELFEHISALFQVWNWCVDILVSCSYLLNGSCRFEYTVFLY